MHRVFVVETESSMYHGTYDVPYAGLSFTMAKERANDYRLAKIKVWLEGTHIETYAKQKAEGKEEREWVKTYDRKEKLAEEIRKSTLELESLVAANILLQEEKQCSTSLEKTAE